MSGAASAATAQASTEANGTQTTQSGTGTTQTGTETAGTTGSQGNTNAAGGNTGSTAQGGGSTETGSTDGNAHATPKAPAKYELSVPKGDEHHVDADDLSQLEKMARESDLTNEEAQAILEAHLGTMKSTATRYLEVTKADKDYGGDKLAETQRLAKLAIDKLRPEGHARRDSFLALVNKAGVGNHIEVVSLLADLGRLFAEDGGLTGGGSGEGKPKSVAEKLYKD